MFVNVRLMGKVKVEYNTSIPYHKGKWFFINNFTFLKY